MLKKMKPESLEGDWDILYKDFPEVYDEWMQIPKVPDFLDVIMNRFPLNGKVVVDVGAGTGLSTFKLAKQAKSVLGIEIMESMLSIMAESALKLNVKNVSFRLGDAEHLPLEDKSVDTVIAVTLSGGDIHKVALEMERVVRSGGLVLRGDVAPGWYGGELMPIITGQEQRTGPTACCLYLSLAV